MPPECAEVFLPVATNHPSYEGHFPGRPVLPGAVLLAESLGALESATQIDVTGWTLANAKFVSPVTPGMALRLRHERLASGSIRFAVHGPLGIVATGLLVANRAGECAP